MSCRDGGSLAQAWRLRTLQPHRKGTRITGRGPSNNETESRVQLRVGGPRGTSASPRGANPIAAVQKSAAMCHNLTSPVTMLYRQIRTSHGHRPVTQNVFNFIMTGESFREAS